jgi:hypothetical protein
MKSPTPYGHKLRRALLITIFTLFSILSLLATYLIATYLPYTSGDSMTVTLPTLVGTRLVEDDERLPAEWYEIVYDYRTDAASEPGTVLSQQSAAGATRRVIPGREPCVIRLTLSTGAARYTLPPMIGKSAHEMLLQLRAQGLIVHLRQQIRNDLSPGQVISVDPPEGTTLCEGEAVTLTESQLSAAVVTIGVIALMIILGLVNQIGTDEEGNRLISSYAVRFVIDWISVLSRFSNLGYGMLDFSALVYYVSLSGVFIFLTVRIYEKRRWG